jgi:molecular chaperone DnaK (HSP70)
MGNNAHAATFLRTTTADLGIRIRDAHTGKPSFQTLIKKGTPLPANARTKVYTTGSHQTKVMLDIIEAGRLGLPSKSIAAYAFGPIDQPQPDTPVEIRFRVDRSGLIDANARHALSGKELPRLQRREDSVRGPSSAFPVHLTLI